MDLPGYAAAGWHAAGDLPQADRLPLARPVVDAQRDRGAGEVVLVVPASVVSARDRGELVGGNVGGRALAPGQQVEPGLGDVGEQGQGRAAPVKAHRHPAALARDLPQLREQPAQLPAASDSDGSATTMNTGPPSWLVIQVSTVAGAGNFSRAMCIFCTFRVP